ncbi:DNA repair protein RadC [Rhizobium sp. ZW T2_16]|uniref:RadC family protein n=1 Tax=Rhizobium sp. ZW T2_16 TaxID=3378083 RepID=UPI0038540E16
MRPSDYLDRLRRKYRAHGDVVLDDQEVLELILFRLKPRGDAKQAAQQLMDRFGTIEAVLNAPIYLLEQTRGVGKSVAFDLKMIATTSQRALKDKVRREPVLSSSRAVIDYCRAMMGCERRELFRILFLGKHHALVGDEVHCHGSESFVSVYPREIVRRALELSASAIILVHNHPSGNLKPSSADIMMTQAILMMTRPMGIELHDHLIVSRNGHASMRALGLI